MCACVFARRACIGDSVCVRVLVLCGVVCRVCVVCVCLRRNLQLLLRSFEIVRSNELVVDVVPALSRLEYLSHIKQVDVTVVQRAMGCAVSCPCVELVNLKLFKTDCFEFRLPAFYAHSMPTEV